jgi:hypothetical protein
MFQIYLSYFILVSFRHGLGRHDSTTALQQVVPCFDASTGDVPEIFGNDAEESVGQQITVVVNGRRKFHCFYSAGEIIRLPKDFVIPHMGLCALVVNCWFCILRESEQDYDAIEIYCSSGFENLCDEVRILEDEGDD